MELVLDKLRTSFGDTARLKGLRLRIRHTAVWVHSDPVLLHRILLNLLSNAVQHTARGSVLVACRPGALPGTVHIQVRDSGVGIAPEHHKKVFEEFYQVENPERDRSKGLGLGLSIVDRSCTLLQHAIALRSALGCGSTFTLQLVRAQPEAPQGNTLLQETHAVRDMHGMRVLLIEDDALGRAALKGLLQSWGCVVLEAATAEQALQHWSLHTPADFIVSDYRLLGERNGVDAVQDLRARAGRAIAACVISGDTDASVKAQVAAAGLLLLQKPVKPAKLRGVLRHAWIAQHALSEAA
jgi:CheY-like chemotaxis protein